MTLSSLVDGHFSSLKRERETVASSQILHASFRRLSQAKVPPDHPKKMFCKIAKKKKNQRFSINLKIFEKKQGFRGKTLRFVDVLAENLVFFRKFSGFLKNIDFFFFFFKTFVSPILGKKNQGREDKENWLSPL